MGSALLIVGAVNLFLGYEFTSLFQGLPLDPSADAVVFAYAATAGVSGVTLVVSALGSFTSARPVPAVAWLVQSALAATGTLSLALSPLVWLAPWPRPLPKEFLLQLAVGCCVAAAIARHLFVQVGRWSRSQKLSDLP